MSAGELLALQRDPCKNLQDALKTFVLSGFDNLLRSCQKSRERLREIKPFEVRSAGFYKHPGSFLRLASPIFSS